MTEPEMVAVARRVMTKREFGAALHLSTSMVDRIVSNGLVRVIYFGDRPLIPVEECDRIVRDGGLHNVPRYKRMTPGPVKGRPRKRGPKRSKKP